MSSPFNSPFQSPRDFPSSPQHSSSSSSSSPSSRSRYLSSSSSNDVDHGYHHTHAHNHPHVRHDYRPIDYIDKGEQLRHNLLRAQYIHDFYNKNDNAIEVYSQENELYTNAPHSLPRVPSPNRVVKSSLPNQTVPVTTTSTTTTTTTNRTNTPSKYRGSERSTNSSLLSPSSSSSSSSSSSFIPRQQSLPSTSRFVTTEDEEKYYEEEDQNDNGRVNERYERKEKTQYEPIQRSPSQKQEKVISRTTQESQRREVPVVQQEDEETRRWRQYQPTKDETREYGMTFAKDVCTFLRHRHSIYIRMRNNWSMGLFYNRLYGFVYMCIFDGLINFQDRASVIFQTYSEPEFLNWLSSQSDFTLSNHESGPKYFYHGTLSKRVMEHAILSDDTELHWSDLRKVYTTNATQQLRSKPNDRYSVQTA